MTQQLYMITNQENKTWRNIQWGENITNSEENPNYFYCVYNSPQIAKYMYPAYERTENPKIWEAQQTENNLNPEIKEFRFPINKLTTIKEVDVKLPTNEQKINFGILCSVNIVTNPKYKEWAKKYLSKENNSKESSKEILELIHLDEVLDQLKNPNEREPDAVAKNPCIHGVINAILTDNSDFAIYAAHRAYHDAKDLGLEIDLEKLAQIIDVIDPKDIAQFI